MAEEKTKAYCINYLYYLKKYFGCAYKSYCDAPENFRDSWEDPKERVRIHCP